MKYLNGNYYVEVKAKRHIIHPTAKNILSLREAPKPQRTQYKVQINTQVRKKNQKVNRNINNDFVVKNYPKKKQTVFQQPKYKQSPNCLSRSRSIWIEFNDGPDF